MPRPHKNLLGQKFGRLTPIEYLGKSIWLCECACSGTQTKTYNSNLISGRTKSCGCIKHIPESSLPPKMGAKYNFYNVINSYYNGKRLYCVCICEKHFTIRNDDKFTTLSCGCLDPDFIKKGDFKKVIGFHMVEHPLYDIYTSAKSWAKKVGIHFDPLWEEHFLWFAGWAESEPTYREFGGMPLSKLFLIRKDLNGGFTRANCEFSRSRDMSGRRARIGPNYGIPRRETHGHKPKQWVPPQK
jgi:hypothetical protein